MIAVAVGTEVPLVFRAYEITDSGERRPVRDPQVVLEADFDGFVDLKDRALIALREGSTDVRLVSPETGVRSNTLFVETIVCTGVDIITPGDQLKRGERTQLTTSFHTATGHRTDLFIHGWVDEQDLGTLGRTGYFAAGHLEGAGTCAVRYGGDGADVQRALVMIGPKSRNDREPAGATSLSSCCAARPLRGPRTARPISERTPEDPITRRSLRNRSGLMSSGSTTTVTSRAGFGGAARLVG